MGGMLMLYLSVKKIIYVPYLYPDLIEVIFDKMSQFP